MSVWATLFDLGAGGAGGAILSGVGGQAVAALRHRRLDDAQVDVQHATEAQIVSNMQGELVKALQRDNQVLRGEVREVKAQLAGVERKLDALAGVCGDTLRHLDALGADTSTYRAALRNST